MEFSNSNMLSVEEILSDVLRNVDDEGMVKISKGYYTSLIRKALEKISFQLYVTKKMEYFDYAPIIDIPKNCWNIREIYLFNGDCCNIETAQNVWWKKNYKGNEANRVTSSTDDPFIKKYSYSDNIYYYNADSGKIYLSSSCATFAKVMIVFNGIGSPIDTTPLIPIRLRTVIVDLTTLEIFRKLKARVSNPKEAQLYRQLYNDTYVNLYDKASGSWWDAIVYANSMDSHSRQSLKEYLSKANA